MTKQRGGLIPRLALTAGGSLAAVGLGWLLYRLGVPLAWLLGPLLVSATLVLANTGFQPIPGGRQFAQLLLGAAVGIQFTPAVVAHSLQWLPLAAGIAVLSIAASALCAAPFRRIARVDWPTAYFATVPGGMSEMAQLGRRQGAQDEAVAIVQALRVGLIVVVLPFVVINLGPNVVTAAPAAAPGSGPMTIAAMFAICIAGGLLARLVGLNNPWMMGPLAASIATAATGLMSWRLPGELLILAQLLIGIALGVRFRRHALFGLPRVVVAGMATVALVTLILGGAAVALSLLTGLPLPTLVLATSPGGMPEMVVTAGALDLDPLLVTAFQIVRVILVNLLAVAIFRAAQRMFHWK